MHLVLLLFGDHFKLAQVVVEIEMDYDTLDLVGRTSFDLELF